MEQPNDGVNADAKSPQPSIMPHITATNAPALELSALSSPLHPSPIIGPTNADDGDDDVEDHATVLALLDFQHEMGTLNPPAATDGDTRELPLPPSHSLGGDDVTEPPPKCDDGAGLVVYPAIVVTNANADGIPPLRERDSDLPSSSSAIHDDQRVSARDYLTALEVSPYCRRCVHRLVFRALLNTCRTPPPIYYFPPCVSFDDLVVHDAAVTFPEITSRPLPQTRGK